MEAVRCGGRRGRRRGSYAAEPAETVAGEAAEDEEDDEEEAAPDVEEEPESAVEGAGEDSEVLPPFSPAGIEEEAVDPEPSERESLR